jgi:flagellar assembly protein FliH
MEALIRSAQMAPARTRLSATVADDAHATGGSAPTDHTVLRARLEQEVREELGLQARAAFDAEQKKGHAQGYAAGLAAAEAAVAERQTQAFNELRTQAEESLALLGQAHRAAMSRMEASVGEVAFASVCRLVGRQAMSHEFVLGLVEEVVADLRVGVMVRARLHPRDLQSLSLLLEHQVPADLALRLEALSLELVADESIALGGCVIETALGEYDGGLEAQLRRLHEVLCTATGTSAPQRRG